MPEQSGDSFDFCVLFRVYFIGKGAVVDIIESMDDAELKKWLTDIVRKDMGLGVKIIINKEE